MAPAPTISRATISRARMRPLLGTLVEIRASGPASRVVDGMAAAFAAIERVQKLMSFHDPESDVSRINAAPVGIDVSVTPETYEVLCAAREIHIRSYGAFDIAIAPSLVREGFLPHPPLSAHIEFTAEQDSPVKLVDLELRADCTVRWRKKGWIDLGGIAKGYAVDLAVNALQSQGIATGLVNAGGDLRGCGGMWPIHLRAPLHPTVLLEIGALDCAIATSAGYFTDRPAKSRHADPLVDPANGQCVPWNASISVIANSCMLADALTKVVRLAPPMLTPLLDHYEAQAVVLDEFGLRSLGRERLRPAAPREFNSALAATLCG